MGKLDHEYRIRPEPLRPLGLPAKSLVGFVVTAFTAIVVAKTTDALSALIG